MKSADLFSQAQGLMPGGVSSPVRAIKPYPFYTEHAEGAHLTTVDGTNLVDCCMAYGPLLLGHAHPEIKKAIAAQLERAGSTGRRPGTNRKFARYHRGPPGHGYGQVCIQRIGGDHGRDPVARGFTGKSDIIKIEGGFHGAHDAVLVKAGSGATTMGVPDRRACSRRLSPAPATPL